MRDAQKADIRNSVMPKDATTGQVIWWELTPGSLIGRAEISSVKQGVASSFSCGTGSCPVSFNGASVSPGSMTAVVGGSGSFQAQETDRDCLGSLFGPYNVNATWSSSNTSVVTVNSSGSASCVGPGTAGLTASWTGTVYQCDAGLNCSTTTVHASPAASVLVKPQVNVTQTMFNPASIVAGSQTPATGSVRISASPAFPGGLQAGDKAVVELIQNTGDSSKFTVNPATKVQTVTLNLGSNVTVSFDVKPTGDASAMPYSFTIRVSDVTRNGQSILNTVTLVPSAGGTAGNLTVTSP